MNSHISHPLLTKKERFLSSLKEPSSIGLKDTATIILAGGEGTRLHPLTLTQSKPEISLGGTYKLIDVALSNAIHSDCCKIFVLTQFLSSSLHQHIFKTYMQQSRIAAQIEILTAEQKPNNKFWYQGTADAVRQNLNYLLEHPAEFFLILSGDQLYNIDFSQMMAFAQKTNADVTIASLPVLEEEASRLGILKVDSNYKILDFHEKPQEKSLLRSLKSPHSLLKTKQVASKKYYLGSMGIYLFKRKALVDLLKEDPREDFGKHLIPTKVKRGEAATYIYEGYWEDIGTVSSFHQANIALTSLLPAFNFHDEERPIFSKKENLPPTKIRNTKIQKSLISEGCLIDAKKIDQSIIGPRSIIHEGTVISKTYVMGNDYYSTFTCDYHNLPTHPSIGKNCIIKNAIIDRNVWIGDNVQLLNKQGLTHYEGENVFIREGIIVVPRGARINHGSII